MRPYIICHMMTSVDGKIVEARWTRPFNSMDSDTLTMPYYEESKAFKADAEMLGRKTVHIHHVPEEFDATGLPATNNPVTFIGKRETERSCIVIDPRGRIHYSQDTMCDENIITILSEKVSDKYLEHLQNQGISYIFAGADGKDIVKAMDTLGEEFKLKKIILQGGGLINGTFLKAGLIDELSLMIYPGIDGLQGTPSLFDWVGAADELPAQGQSLQLSSMKDLGNGLVWLRYKFHKSK